MSSNKITGASFNRYDARHLDAVTRHKPKSVAPNVLKDLKAKYQIDDDDLDAEELLRLLSQDELELSEEAMDLLRKHRKRKKKKRGRGRQQAQSEEEFLELLGQLEEQEPVLTEAPLHMQESKPFLPPVITLSSYSPVVEQNRPKPKPRRIEEGEEVDFRRLNRAGRTALEMIVECPNKISAMRVAQDLEVFGNDMISEVKKFGTRIIVIPPHQRLTDLKIAGMFLVGDGAKTHDGRSWSVVRGIYASKRRVIVMGEELLEESGRGGQSVVRHEFAHAYEDAWSTPRQRRHPLSVELWYRFEKTRKAFVSQYASTKPAEYFAESVDAYFIPRTRTLLAQSDPEMYTFLTELFS